MVRFGEVGHGKVRLGRARSGKTRTHGSGTHRGSSPRPMSRPQGRAVRFGSASSGWVRCGSIWQGMARRRYCPHSYRVLHYSPRHGRVWLVLGVARSGAAWCGAAWRGEAGHGTARTHGSGTHRGSSPRPMYRPQGHAVRRGGEGRGLAKLAVAGLGMAWRRYSSARPRMSRMDLHPAPIFPGPQFRPCGVSHLRCQRILRCPCRQQCFARSTIPVKRGRHQFICVSWRPRQLEWF
jgi:hypothetical protein